jgi:hypothetical protein
VEITTRDANDVKVVQIEGELDTGSSPEVLHLKPSSSWTSLESRVPRKYCWK